MNVAAASRVRFLRIHAQHALRRIDDALGACWRWLSPAAREWLCRYRSRILFCGTLAVALDGDAWLVSTFVLAAYCTQALPRRAGVALGPAIAGLVVALWLMAFGGSLGLADPDQAGPLTWGIDGLAVVAGLRVAEGWIRGSGDADSLPAGVLLGRDDRGWVAAPPQHGTLVIGPPRSGKTSAVIIPNVLAWRGPVVTTSTRRDVLDACAPRRVGLGRACCCDPLGVVRTLPAGVERYDWSPLRGCERWDVAVARARDLLDGAGTGLEEASHWRVRGQQLLAALLHAARERGLVMSTMVEWVHAGRHEPAQRILADAGAVRPLAILDGIARTPARERGSIWSSVAGALAAFDVGTVAASADRADVTGELNELLDSQSTLFVVAPSDHQASLAPLVVGLVEEVRATAVRRSELTGPLDPPLLLALDEVANICPLRALPQIASEGGGRNIVLLAAFQDLSQAAERWGRTTADGLLTLAGAKLVLPGVADSSTLRQLEVLCGLEWTDQETRSETSGGILSPLLSSTQHHGVVQQPRMPSADIRTLEAGTALCIVGNAPHRVIQLVPAHSTHPFRAWVP